MPLIGLKLDAWDPWSCGYTRLWLMIEGSFQEQEVMIIDSHAKFSTKHTIRIIWPRPCVPTNLGIVSVQCPTTLFSLCNSFSNSYTCYHASMLYLNGCGDQWKIRGFLCDSKDKVHQAIYQWRFCWFCFRSLLFLNSYGLKFLWFHFVLSEL